MTSTKSSGIASQLLEHLLKNDDTPVTPIDSEVTRRDTMDSEENALTEKATNEAPKVPGQRKRREILKCPHTDRKHYAKNMCHNCYHRKGKTKMAWACGHTNKSHYSSGMCQNCYLAKYYIKRKTKMEEKERAKREEQAISEETIASENNSSLGKRSAPAEESAISAKLTKTE